MATTTPPSDIDPQEIQRAQTMWDRFCFICKWSIISVSVVLLLMALTLVRP